MCLMVAATDLKSETADDPLRPVEMFKTAHMQEKQQQRPDHWPDGTLEHERRDEEKTAHFFALGRN